MIVDTKKEWSLREIEDKMRELKREIPRAEFEITSKEQRGAPPEWAGLYQEATDFVGRHLIRGFRKVGDDCWQEIDVMKEVGRLAKALSKSLKVDRILREVLVKLEVADLTDLMERIDKKGKVTVGVRRGSCVFLYIRGKRGRPLTIQITE